MCKECGEQIPAEILHTATGVWLNKKCKQHWTTPELIEKNVMFYDQFRDSKNPIYSAHFVDITGACQLDCKYCYRPKTRHKSVSEVFRQLLPGKQHILIGGEPTVHPQFFEIAKMCADVAPTGVITNFIKMMDKHFLLKTFRYLDPTYSSMSHHSESGIDLFEVAEHLLKNNVRLQSLTVVIDNVTQLEDIVPALLQLPQGAFETFRIKGASNIWNTAGVEPIFNSDIVGWFYEHFADFRLFPMSRYNYASFVAGNRNWITVKWHTIDNVDTAELHDLEPTMYANDGTLNHQLISYLKNGFDDARS
jgi:organic radical activating enzyme